MLYYVIQVGIFQLLFLLVYDTFLRRETFFNWNRLYLLMSSVLALIVPFLKFETIRNLTSEQFMIKLPEVIIGQPQSQMHINQVEQDFGFWSWEWLWFIGMGIAALFFLIKLIHLMLIIKNNPKRWKGNILLVKLINETSAYSFFNYVFLGDKIPEAEQEDIINHERVHVRQKHSLDLLFFEVMRIVFWFNPLVYIYQYRIKELHEYIADAEVVKQTEIKQYCQQLLSELFQTKSISFINPFIKQSLIKKRIVMLQKSKSKQVQLLKYLLIFPLLFGMLFFTASCEGQSKIVGDTNKEQETLLLEVKDLKNLTEAEVREKEEKMKQFFNDSSLNRFIITDGVMKTTLKKEDEETIHEIDGYDAVDVPFSVVEEVPRFAICDELTTNEERKECMTHNLQRFVAENFDTKLASNLNLKGRIKIYVTFKISTMGEVTDIVARAPHTELEDEAKRVIESLPKFIPGKQKGKAVAVLFSLPIMFQVNE